MSIQNNSSSRNNSKKNPSSERNSELFSTPVNPERFNKHVDTILSQAGSIFLQTRMDHLLYLEGDGDATMILAYLLNEERVMTRNHKQRGILLKDRMFFECPMADMVKEMGMWDTKISRKLAILEEKKIITRAWRWNKILWIRINDGRLRKIEEWGKDKTTQIHNKEEQEEKSDPLKQRNRSAKTAGLRDPLKQRDSTKKKEEQRKTSRLQANDGVESNSHSFDSASSINGNSNHHQNGKNSSVNDNGHVGLNGIDIPTSNKFYIDVLAGRLYKEVKRLDKLGLNGSRSESEVTRGWSRSLRILERVYDPSFIQDVLDDHIIHLGEQGQPHAFCGKTICTKIVAIIDAKDRRKKPRSKFVPVPKGGRQDEKGRIWDETGYGYTATEDETGFTS